MRKKYLSALLFGALLFASAGTFTSCKDYDDDINNLQEQINTVKTSLDELSEKINSLGAGVTDFKYENGQLVIVTDKGTNFTVDVADFTGITKLEIKDGILYADGEKVGAVAGEDGSVVEVKGGVLYIDGEAQELTVGDKVAVVDNGNGTYTLTVGENSYVLPKASALISSISVAATNAYNTDEGFYFSEAYLTNNKDAATAGKGINWGVAGADVADWKGPKGDIQKGQLLVGAINELSVRVTPLRADLKAAKLALVDVNGKEAPVTVTATPAKTESDATTGSRAAYSLDGTWNLAIVPTATAENIATAYTDGKSNLLYALSVDGTVMTDYTIVVDTWTADESKANADAPVPSNANLKIGDAAKNSFNAVKVGKNALVYEDASVYDVYFEFAKESIDDAELYGITIDNTTNTLVVSEKAAGLQDGVIKLKYTLMGVNGVASETQGTVTVKFASTTIDEGETISGSTYQLTAGDNKGILVDLGNTFTSLSAEEALKISNTSNAVWSTEETKFILSKTQLAKASGSVMYYATEEDAKAGVNDINLNDNTADERVRTIKYAVIPVENYFSSKANNLAEKGLYNLTLTLKNSTNEIKKVVVPVTVTLPTFDSMFTKATDGFWEGDVRTVRMNGDKQINLSEIFKSSSVSNYNTDLKYKSLKYTNAAGTATDFASSIATKAINSSVEMVSGYVDATTKAFVDNTLDAVVYYQFGNMTKMTVEKSFTVKVKSQFDGASLVYYTKKDTPAADGIAVVDPTKNIVAGGDKSTETGGLALSFEGQELALVGSSDGGAFKGTIAGLTFVQGTIAGSGTQIAYQLAVRNSTVTKAGEKTTGIEIGSDSSSHLAKGQTGELVITFYDYAGVKTEATITVKK